MENPQVVCVLLLLKYSHKTRRLEITASASVISKFSCSGEDDNSFIAFQVSMSALVLSTRIYFRTKHPSMATNFALLIRHVNSPSDLEL
ncbi:hypothetical protein Peur_034125 [Populus x canadensis]